MNAIIRAYKTKIPRFFISALVVAALFWFFESILEFASLNGMRLWEYIFMPGIHELWMRGVITALILCFGILVELSVRRIHRSTRRIDHINKILLSLRAIDQLIVRVHTREELLGESCRILKDNQEYNNCWIALLDETGKATALYESGIPDAKELLFSSLNSKNKPACVQECLRSSGLTVIAEPAKTCTNCPIKHLYRSWSAFAIRLSYAGRSWGFMCASVPKRYSSDSESQRLYIEIAEDLAFALHNFDIQRKLNDNIKALRMREFAIDSSSAAIVFVNLDMELFYINESFISMWCFEKRSEVLGRQPTDFWESNETSDKLCKALTQYREWKGELTGIKKDQSKFPLDVSASTVTDGENEPMCYMMIFRDITESKILERELRQSQKMETIGRLASGIAHDFNNLLTIVSLTSEVALMQLDQGDTFYEEFEDIRRTARKAGELTSALLAYARQQVAKPVVVEINACLYEMERLLKRLVGEDIEFRLHVTENLWKTKIDPSQFKQVLVNLVVNAREAMPSGGSLTIETENISVAESDPGMEFSIKAGEYVVCNVSDTGIGMSDDTKKHIFEPFFTNKSDSRGTGLGLATCYGIVRQNEGYIWVESQPGEGAMFRVYLPRATGKEQKRVEDTGKTVDLSGTESILLVEDDKGVRENAADVLRQRGYTVIEALDGAEAMEIIEDRRPQVDLLLTDIVMPRMGGKMLQSLLEPLCPGVRTLFMSGYDGRPGYKFEDLKLDTLYLRKPFSVNELLSNVRQVLDAG